MKLSTLLLCAIAFLSLTSGQGVGKNPEHHPALPIQECSRSGCSTQQTSLVLDANWRWYHDGLLEGATYSISGLSTNGSKARLNFITNGNVGSRSYLLQGNNYRMFKLLNKEISFEVDVSTLQCGMNGAVYLVQMDQDGGMRRNPRNQAGAAYGTGYCDAQCPKDQFTGSRACCMEMDLWEANKISTAFTAHACSAEGVNANASCASIGCSYNTYALGNHGYYGPGSGFTVDSTKPMTVVTQFVTHDNTPSGNLVRINRFYVQNGRAIKNAAFSGRDFLSDAQCREGGLNLEQLGKSLRSGMALSFSLWTGDMTWLDSGNSGTCSPNDEQYAKVITHKDAFMSVGNIRVGDIGTTTPRGRQLESASLHH